MSKAKSFCFEQKCLAVRDTSNAEELSFRYRRNWTTLTHEKECNFKIELKMFSIPRLIYVFFKSLTLFDCVDITFNILNNRPKSVFLSYLFFFFFFFRGKKIHLNSLTFAHICKHGIPNKQKHMNIRIQSK